MEALIWILVALAALALLGAVTTAMRRNRPDGSVAEPTPPEVVPDPADPANPVAREIRSEGGRV